LAKKLPNIVKEIISSPPKKMNFARDKNVSFSQISIFNQCPHRWKLQYKDKIKTFNSSIHTVFGTAIHEVIQNYLTVMYNESKVKANRIDLEESFKEKFREEYLTQYKKNDNNHFSSSEEMREFYEDGVKILSFLKKKVNAYFSKRGWHLVGIELPILQAPVKIKSNILYMGFLDVVLYNENSDTFEIIDIKTSTRGWNDKTKKDELKQYQLILYKKYFSEQYGIPLDKIDIKFFIVKRKIWEDSKYNISRIQEFRPPSGKIKLGRATKFVNNFIDEVFSTDGLVRDMKYPKQVSQWNCRFCPFGEDEEHCGAGKKFFGN
jgi:hypothetical protein